jgi:hypothetical protein
LSFKNVKTRRLLSATLCAGFTLGLSGCLFRKHQVKIPPLPPVLAPVTLVEVPRPSPPPMLAPPHIKMPPEPVSAAAAKFPRERRRPVVKPEPPDEPVTTPPPVPDTVAIGSLTAGGETNPQSKQAATDLIASNDKRLSALPAPKSDDQKAEISTVKNFQRQAQEALTSGDAEGAMTLATKAKLLLDDLEK